MQTVLIPTDHWRNIYPTAAVGVLVMHNVANPGSHAALATRKLALVNELRDRFAGQDRNAVKLLPAIQAYNAYYRRFDKSYHVQLQLESVVFKGKAIPNVAALVEAMFMAELQDQLLTAGHDLDQVQLPLTLDVAQGTERYTLLRGDEQTLKADDMFIADQRSILSSILYGPDQRTRINAATCNALFTVYAPPGISISQVKQHLETIQANALLIAPTAQTMLLHVYGEQ